MYMNLILDMGFVCYFNVAVSEHARWRGVAEVALKLQRHSRVRAHLRWDVQRWARCWYAQGL